MEENANNDNNNPTRFEAQLERIRSNKIKALHFIETIGGDQPWTLLQAKELSSALMVNTSVFSLSLSLAYWPLPAIRLLLDYVRSSSKLEHVVILSHDHVGNAETREKYDRKIGDVFRAVSKNPFIKQCTVHEWGNSPQAVFELLSETKTLEHFHAGQIINGSATLRMEIAQHVAAGLAQNSSLNKIDIGMTEDYLAIVLSGIGRSTIKSLSVQSCQASQKFLSVIAGVLPVAPSLKMLEVSLDEEHMQGDDESSDDLFCNLRNPGCRLEHLVLRQIYLGSSLNGAAATRQVNHILQVLALEDILFSSPSSIRLLWHLVGLKELRVVSPYYKYDEEGCRPKEEQDEECRDCWKELILRNRSLLKISVKDTEWVDCAEGVVLGACGHESLESLEIDMTNGVQVNETVGRQLCRLFQETEPLKTCTLSRFVAIEPKGAQCLVEGICENKTLQSFRVESWHSLSFPILTSIVESFVINQTVKTFDIHHDTGDTSLAGNDDDKRAFCNTLSNVFRVNTALESFRLPTMDINEMNGLMSVLVDDGLAHNKTITSIDFSKCTLDHTALTCLEHALLVNDGPNALSISSVLLPQLTAQEGIKPFLRNLAAMPGLRNVAIKDSLDAEAKQLLLQVVKAKKTLYSFERETDESLVNDAIDNEIDFYLKLNRYGRQIVTSSTVPTSCWPIVLSRMTTTTTTTSTNEPTSDYHDEDALFYFVCKYFSIQHAPQQQQHERSEAPHKRPCGMIPPQDGVG